MEKREKDESRVIKSRVRIGFSYVLIMSDECLESAHRAGDVLRSRSGLLYVDDSLYLCVYVYVSIGLCSCVSS